MTDEAEEHLHRLRRICAGLPDTWEKLSHGTPTFFAGKHVFAIFDNNHHNQGKLGVWLASQLADQELLVSTDPRKYYRPPYVGHKGWVGVQLTEVDDDVLGYHLREAWQLIAGKQKKTAKRAY